MASVNPCLRWPNVALLPGPDEEVRDPGRWWTVDDDDALLLPPPPPPRLWEEAEGSMTPRALADRGSK